MSVGLIWICVGALMMIMEFSMPGIFICFFGVAALFTGGICLLFPQIPLILQLLIFAVAGIAGTLIGRKISHGSVTRGKGDSLDDDIIGSYAVVTEAVVPPKAGKVEFHGSFWNAVSDREIPVGTQVVIVERKNLTLTVKDQ